VFNFVKHRALPCGLSGKSFITNLLDELKLCVLAACREKNNPINIQFKTALKDLNCKHINNIKDHKMIDRYLLKPQICKSKSIFV